MSVFSLEGEVALITGGGTGIGYSVAECMITQGAQVIIIGRREDVLADAVSALGDRASYYVHDLTDFAAAPGLVAQICGDIGPVSILVNNAGVHLKKPVTETSVDGFQGVLNTHLTGAFALSKAVVPGMQQMKHGSLIFMASMTALMGMPYVVAYAAAKSAYLGVVRTLASELAADGIRANAIAPGWIETPMLHQALDGDKARTQKILNRTPLARFGEPSDIGWTAAYLCSPAAKFITGQLIAVDGGASIGF